jgi:putative ABC transport system ATP-binding protein
MVEDPMPSREIPRSPTPLGGDGAPADREEDPAALGDAEARGTAGSETRRPAAVQVTGIGRRDPKGEGWLIRDVSLVVEPGERLAILGNTGAGKTVLLRALALLDPLHAGSIRWRGRVVRGEDVPAYRTQVIYLHQRPALLDGSVEDNLRHPFTLRAHRGRRFDRRPVLELLEGLGRPAAFLAKSSRDLSGGEAQIVALLRAVQLDPAVLLLDEPTASLDPATARAVEGLIDRWFAAGRGGRSLVWVSHDHDQAHRVTGRRLLMRSGRLESEE